MSPPDREREQFEALVAAYRQLPRAEPPAERDRAILEAARAALPRQPVARPRWPAMLGTAATLVLAFGLAWQMRDQDLRVPSPASQETAPTAESVAAPADAASARPGKPDAPAEVVAQATAMRDAEAREQEALQSRPAEPDHGGGERARAPQDAAGAPETLERARAPAAAPPAPPPPPAPPAAVRDMHAADTAVREERVAAPASEPMQDAVSPEPPPAETPVLAEPFPADPPAVSATAGKPSPEAPSRRSDAPAPAAAAESAAQAAPAGAAGMLKRSAAGAGLMPAEEWVEEIRRLLRQGQRERARERLAAFREAYPDESIPEDLRELGR